MDQTLSSLVEELDAAVGAPLSRQLAITWLRYPNGLNVAAETTAREPLHRGAASMGRGASWQGERCLDPGALIQLPYLVAVEAWMQRDLLPEEPELRRALAAMVRQGSPEATAYVVDRLSGTTGGPSLLKRLPFWPDSPRNSCSRP